MSERNMISEFGDGNGFGFSSPQGEQNFPGKMSGSSFHSHNYNFHHNAESVSRSEIDAKIELSETRIAGSIKSIKDSVDDLNVSVADIKKQYGDLVEKIYSQKLASIGTMFGTVVAVAAVIYAAYSMGFSSFDSGRDTAQLVMAAQSKIEKDSDKISRSVMSFEVLVEEARSELKNSVAESRKILMEIKKSPDVEKEEIKKTQD